MSKDSFSNFRISEFKIGSVSNAISAAFGKPASTNNVSRESSVKKKLTNLREMSGSGKETFLTEAEINEIEVQALKDGHNPMTYEDMIKEIDDLRYGMKSRESDLSELKRRLEKCQSEIEIRETGLNGIDRTLSDIHSQNKEMMKKISFGMSVLKRDNDDFTLKILTIGDSSVGKTALIVRYTENVFSHKFMSTIGVDFKVKDLTVNNKNVRVQIWDTAGQERFRNITNSYYKGANGIAIVFDVTNRKSFETVSTWIEEISKKAGQNSLNVIIANKIDLINHRVVSKEEGEALATSFGLSYFETSAKDDYAVTSVFEFMADKILSNIQASSGYIANNKASVLQKDKKEKKEGKCC